MKILCLMKTSWKELSEEIKEDIRDPLASIVEADPEVASKNS